MDQRVNLKNEVSNQELKSIKLKNIKNEILERRELTLGLTILLICIVSSFAFPTSFPTGDNLKGILLGISLETIVGVGMMILMIAGIFDLSVGSVVTFSGALCTYMLKVMDVNMWLAILLTLVVCSLVGLINGLLVAKVGVNAMITTLAMMGIIKGFGIIIAGSGIVNLPKGFNQIGQGMFLGLQMPIWFMFLIVTFFTVLILKTRYFRKYYYIGGNEKAAVLSGINASGHKIVSFMITSTLAGFVGIIMAARFGASVASAGEGLELKVISATILGGASLSGGQGTIIGALMGTAFMGLINNLMILSKISVYWQGIIVGVILVLAVVSDVTLKKRK